MKTPEFFKILPNYEYKGPAKHPATISWSMVEKYERQAKENHQYNH